MKELNSWGWTLKENNQIVEYIRRRHVKARWCRSLNCNYNSSDFQKLSNLFTPKYYSWVFLVWKLHYSVVLNRKGSAVVINIICENKHGNKWSFQPELNWTFTGNILLALGILYPGNNFSRKSEVKANVLLF